MFHLHIYTVVVFSLRAANVVTWHIPTLQWKMSLRDLLTLLLKTESCNLATSGRYRWNSVGEYSYVTINQNFETKLDWPEELRCTSLTMVQSSYEWLRLFVSKILCKVGTVWRSTDKENEKTGGPCPPEKPTEGTTDRFQVYLSGREKFNDPSNVIADQAGLQILTLRNYQPHIASFLPHFTAKRRTPTICHRNIVVDIRLEIFFRPQTETANAGCFPQGLWKTDTGLQNTKHLCYKLTQHCKVYIHLCTWNQADHEQRGWWSFGDMHKIFTFGVFMPAEFCLR